MRQDSHDGGYLLRWHGKDRKECYIVRVDEDGHVQEWLVSNINHLTAERILAALHREYENGVEDTLQKAAETDVIDIMEMLENDDAGIPQNTDRVQKGPRD